jgi:hypothetical protein
MMGASWRGGARTRVLYGRLVIWCAGLLAAELVAMAAGLMLRRLGLL